MKMYDEVLDAPDGFDPDNPVMFAEYLQRVHDATARAVKAGHVPVIVRCHYDYSEAFWKLDAIFPLAADTLHLDIGTPKTREQALDVLRVMVLAYMRQVGWIDESGKNTLF